MLKINKTSIIKCNTIIKSNLYLTYFSVTLKVLYYFMSNKIIMEKLIFQMNLKSYFIRKENILKFNEFKLEYIFYGSL